MLINVSRICKSFGDKAVLKDLSFQLNVGDRVGLIGRNGTGKSTLLRILTGLEEVDSGTVTKQPSLRIGYLEQMTRMHGHDQPEETLLENALGVFLDMDALAGEIDELQAEIEDKSTNPEVKALLDRYGHLQTKWETLGGYSYESKAKAVLSGLGFNEREFSKCTSVLSGGESNRLKLAKLLLSDSDLLLLDEPTNHLDLSAARWLEEFLIQAPQTFVLISHDRYLLDSTVSTVIELCDGSLEEYPGNYSHYIEEREQRRSARQKAYQQQQKTIARTEEFIRRNLAGQKTKQAKSRRKSLEKLDRLKAVPKDRPESGFQFGIQSESSDLVLQLSNLSIGYPGYTLARDINLTIYRGENMGIVGPNGSGKSTLLKTLLSRQLPLSGEVHFGGRVHIGFYDQQISSLDGELTVLDSIRQVAPLAQEEALRKFLARFLFTGTDVFQSCASLSGGEKSRLVLAKLIYGGANTLLLDEPTNHLDIPSCEALEGALAAFPGTLLIVSHDRYLLNKLVDQVLYLDGDGNGMLFEGSYDQFEQTRRDLLVNPKTDAVAVQFAQKTEMNAAPHEQPMSKNQRARLNQRCVFLESEIGRIEECIESVGAELNSPDLGKDFNKLKEISRQQSELNTQLNQLYKEWEVVLARLETSTKPVSKND